MSILVSINCMTYNHEKYISDAIEGFLMQKTDFNYEILIGEDCSTDKTRIIVEEYADRYPDKIKLITSRYNVGERKNTLRLIEDSKGKYIAVCEGDDYWTDPYKLQKQFDYMEKNPECSLCFHASETKQANKKSIGKVVRPYNKNGISPTEDFILGGGGFCHTGSLFYPKSLMGNPPDFFSSAPVGDYPMQMLLASHGYAYYIDDCMSVYRSEVKGSWSMSMNNKGSVRENVIELNEGIIKLLDGFDMYKNEKYSIQIGKIKRRLEFELLVLKRETKGQIDTTFNEFNWLYKKRMKLKIFIRCQFPKMYVKLVNLKDARFFKMLKI